MRVGVMNDMSKAKSHVPRSRIEGLSDLIFGLALSIGAIQLVGNTPKTHGQLITALAAFGFSFLIVINVWHRYTTIVSMVPVETTGMMRLNMLLLFMVAVEPYLFNLLVIQGMAFLPLGQDVSAYFALDIGGMNLVLAYFAHLLTREEKILIPLELIHSFRLTRDRILVAGLIFVISATPIFWTFTFAGIPLRIFLWAVTLPPLWLSRVFVKQ
jgi:uncharacterized membrane protein